MRRSKQSTRPWRRDGRDEQVFRRKPKKKAKKDETKQEKDAAVDGTDEINSPSLEKGKKYQKLEKSKNASFPSVSGKKTLKNNKTVHGPRGRGRNNRLNIYATDAQHRTVAASYLLSRPRPAVASSLRSAPPSCGAAGPFLSYQC